MNLPTTDKLMYNGQYVDEDSIFRGVAVLVLVVDSQVNCSIIYPSIRSRP